MPGPERTSVNSGDEEQRSIAHLYLIPSTLAHPNCPRCWGRGLYAGGTMTAGVEKLLCPCVEHEIIVAIGVAALDRVNEPVYQRNRKRRQWCELLAVLAIVAGFIYEWADASFFGEGNNFFFFAAGLLAMLGLSCTAVGRT